jgi:hypothetical protein
MGEIITLCCQHPIDSLKSKQLLQLVLAVRQRVNKVLFISGDVISGTFAPVFVHMYTGCCFQLKYI